MGSGRQLGEAVCADRPVGVVPGLGRYCLMAMAAAGIRRGWCARAGVLRCWAGAGCGPATPDGGGGRLALTHGILPDGDVDCEHLGLFGWPSEMGFGQHLETVLGLGGHSFGDVSELGHTCCCDGLRPKRISDTRDGEGAGMALCQHTQRAVPRRGYCGHWRPFCKWPGQGITIRWAVGTGFGLTSSG